MNAQACCQQGTQFAFCRVSHWPVFWKRKRRCKHQHDQYNASMKFEEKKTLKIRASSEIKTQIPQYKNNVNLNNKKARKYKRFRSGEKHFSHRRDSDRSRNRIRAMNSLLRLLSSQSHEILALARARERAIAWHARWGLRVWTKRRTTGLVRVHATLTSHSWRSQAPTSAANRDELKFARVATCQLKYRGATIRARAPVAHLVTGYEAGGESTMNRCCRRVARGREVLRHVTHLWLAERSAVFLNRIDRRSLFSPFFMLWSFHYSARPPCNARNTLKKIPRY